MIFDPMYFVFILPGLALSIWASVRVKSTFNKCRQATFWRCDGETRQFPKEMVRRHPPSFGFRRLPVTSHERPRNFL